jgi:predicted transposase YbfD/YdcC
MTETVTKKSLIDYFSALEDPRQAWKVEYPLAEIMLLVLCATLAGAETFVETAQWGRTKLEFLRKLLPFKRGIPSHDALNDVVNGLDADLFSECFSAWVVNLKDRAPDLNPEPEVVAIDGKTSRRAHTRAGHALHTVSAWAARQRLVLGQQATAEKSNEITAIPLLLERLQLTGALVTIDAMGCQTAIAQKVIDGGADYLLALKNNQLSLAREVELFFNDPERRPETPQETMDADHGRIEVRRHWVSHDVDWLTSERRFPNEPRFPGLKAIAMVEAVVEEKATGKTSTARRFYISSLALDQAFFAKAVRAHWGVENRLHWVLDVVFHDDLMRLRTQNGPKNMATVKHMALNLLKSSPAKASLRVKRKTAGWDDTFLLATIRSHPQ